MDMPLAVKEFKAWTTSRGQIIGVIATDSEAGTSLRPIRRERSHDRHPTRTERPLGEAHIALSFGRTRQEMEQSAVVPNIELANVLDPRYVADDPFDSLCLRPQANFGQIQTRR